MIRAMYGPHHGSSNNWELTLSAPSKVMVAYTSDEVIELIHAAERESLRGSYVAMFLTYEAAPAFDSALVTHLSGDSLPLAWAGVFTQPDTFPRIRKEKYKEPIWTPRISEFEYREAIGKILDFIRAGDTYQVNYSFPMTATFAGDPFSYYLDLMTAQGARYSAFIDLEDVQIISLSPELFFERKGRRVRTKPMKGTIRRGRWTTEDLQLAKSLRESAKDQAENVMIVDLLRNDLGRVSETGSVTVSKLFELERFETLWQMTSTIESTLKEAASLADILRAVFPCGSVTGAPKVSTMKIIKQLEPYPRGIYTGAIGFLRPGGDCIFNVAIRTLQLEKQSGVLTFGVGGGVTIDSTAEREYSECLVKSAFLGSPNSSFQLLETMLLEDGKVFLFERHITRLADSAQFFSFQFIEEDLRLKLERLASDHPSGTWKIRSLLSKDGAIQIEIKPVELRSHVRRVAFATEPINSANRMLFHKTTDRSAFQPALTALSEYDDVVFWNERSEVTEAANANIVVEFDGQMSTPPVSSGLLAGTFREQLLAEGSIMERVITVEELLAIKQFYLINSVQKWMRARLEQKAPEK